ncbi:hypothetical protein BJX61DRAFT_541283 [Aspergillus egyptiacus]|nr:hypothetical protein BJX61DRAFT_541283 [Aspergillus egyptiacus]
MNDNASSPQPQPASGAQQSYQADGHSPQPEASAQAKPSGSHHQDEHAYCRRLEVVFTSWSGRHLRVTEDTPSRPLVYAGDLKTRKPQMIFHNFSSIIDISINGEEIPMRTVSKWKYEYGYDSPALGGTKLIWRRGRSWTKWLDLECVDESGATVYARFLTGSSWSLKKAGWLEILEPVTTMTTGSNSKGLVDELVVTGLANVYLQLMQNLSASAAAA